jgi:Tfp pilus assembly protein PilX
MGKQTTYKASERGVALIFALLATLVLSILAVAILTTSMAQNWTAYNYRLSAQSRYAAEAGVQQTMNWLSSAAYTPPTFASYTMTTNPVTYLGNPVVLSAIGGVGSNYPDAAVVANYVAAAAAPVPNLSNVTYATSATLLRMTPSSGVSWLPGSGGGVVQTWQITSVGTVKGVRSSTVQVTQTYERAGEPIFQYGLEALSNACGSITLTNGDSTDSYNSANGVYSTGGGGNNGALGTIATNGNVNLDTTAVIKGNIAVPIATVGACPGHGLTDAGAGNYTKLTSTTPLTAPPPFGCAVGVQPCYPSVPPVITTAQNLTTASCASIAGCTKNVPPTVGLTDGGSAKTANAFTLAPGSYGNLTVNAQDVVHVTAGTYTINSINFAQDGQFVVDSGPVVFQLAGKNCASGCPSETGIPTAVTGLPTSASIPEVIYGASLAGMNGCAPVAGVGVVSNPDVYGKETCGVAKGPFSGIPSNMQIVYGGTNLIRLGGMPNAAVIYSPSGEYYTPGAPVGLYGSVITNTFDDASGSPWHYDTAALNSVMQVGQFRPVGGFSWSKF